MSGFRRLLSVGLLVLLAATWKLWTPQVVYPQVPLLSLACHFPRMVDWICLGIVVTSAVSILVVETFYRQTNIWRRTNVLSHSGIAMGLAGLFVLDQHRLQPWAWQFFLLACVFALASDQTALRCWRWLAIGIYFWSAISKFDVTFCHEQGPALLTAFRRAIGLHGIATTWTETIDVIGSLGLGISELIVALLMVRKRWMRIGLGLSIAMHSLLLVSLGPWGLNHSSGVLLWNIFFIVQNVLIWRATPSNRIGPMQMNEPENASSNSQERFWPDQFRDRLAMALIGLVVVWPVLEPIGLCDHWLAWEVYSARSDTMKLVVDGSEMDVGRWSLEELRAPVYPQDRFLWGIATAVIEKQGKGLATITIRKPGKRWESRSDASVQTITIDRQSKRDEFHLPYFWNSQPRRTTLSLDRR